MQYVSQVTSEPNNLFKFRKIEITELEMIVKQMNDKPGHECVPNRNYLTFRLINQHTTY